LKTRAILIFLLAATMPSAFSAEQHPRVLLAVFAHPDDETFVGPVLARYAREGVKVYLAIATKGEKGANEHAKIPAGDALAQARHGEAICACKHLGIEPPIFFDLNDGELGAMTNPLAKNVHAVADNVEKLIAQLHPQVVVTWGAVGGYGHPDHRLVSDAVTQVIQARKSEIKLYYAALTPEQAKPVNQSWPAAIPWHTTDPAYAPVSIAYTKKDQEAFHQGLECHKSQFTAEEMQQLEKAMDEGWSGQVAFRPWASLRKSNDLFAREGVER
jgi:LmbE family N-acetylglucosaminyl deacetylase